MHLHHRDVPSAPSPRTRSPRAHTVARSPVTRAIGTLALVGSVSACSSTGDTGELLLEVAQACGTVCTSRPDIDALSYRAGGGVPLLFFGGVEASCECAATSRTVDSPLSMPEDEPS